MRSKKAIVLEDLSERECLFHESEGKRRLERATLRMLVHKLISSMQVDLQCEQDQTQGFDSEEFAAFIFTRVIKKTCAKYTKVEKVAKRQYNAMQSQKSSRCF